MLLAFRQLRVSLLALRPPLRFTPGAPSASRFTPGAPATFTFHSWRSASFACHTWHFSHLYVSLLALRQLRVFLLALHQLWAPRQIYFAFVVRRRSKWLVHFPRAMPSRGHVTGTLFQAHAATYQLHSASLREHSCTSARRTNCPVHCGSVPALPPDSMPRVSRAQFLAQPASPLSGLHMHVSD